MIELYIIGGFAALVAASAARGALKAVWRRLLRSKVKGHAGESKVNRVLKKFTHKGARGKNDILIEHGRGTSQIDHLLITKQGIVVLETKNYSGRITGTEKGRLWTQSFPGSYTEPRQFYNPIKQNEGHIEALQAILKKYKDVPMHSLVVFAGDCSFPQLPGVVSASGLKGAIDLFTSGTAILSEEQIKEIESIIEKNMILGRSTRAAHNYQAGVNAASSPEEVQALINESIKNSVYISTKSPFPEHAATPNQERRQLLTDTHAKLTIRGRTDTIDGFFEKAKRRDDGQQPFPGGNFDYFICPYTGDRFPASEALSLYQGLWISYLNQNPELVSFMKENGTENLGNSYRCRKVLALYNEDKEGFTEQARSSDWYRHMADKQRKKRTLDNQIQGAANRGNTCNNSFAPKVKESFSGR